MRVPALSLRSGDRQRLTEWTRSSSIRGRLAQRARIILLAADGVSNTAIADLAGVSRPTVISLRARYGADGMGGLIDEPRSGRPREVDRSKIIAVTLTPPPRKLGITHWSSRLLAEDLKTSNSTIARAWREAGVQPWQSQTFKFSTEPALVAKVTDIVGLYLAPPENAIVLCVEAKPQIQESDRTAPMQPFVPENRTHDDVRHRTTLFSALDIATGQVTGVCQPPQRHQEFLRFLKQVAKTYPTGELHLVMDNHAAPQRVEINTWLTENPRIQVHFTPTCACWLKIVEVWFGIIERQAVHRGTFASVSVLIGKIRGFINGWNDRSSPFVWTKPRSGS